MADSDGLGAISGTMRTSGAQMREVFDALSKGSKKCEQRKPVPVPVGQRTGDAAVVLLKNELAYAERHLQGVLSALQNAGDNQLSIEMANDIRTSLDNVRYYIAKLK